jgi:hypothetical protein
MSSMIVIISERCTARLEQMLTVVGAIDCEAEGWQQGAPPHPQFDGDLYLQLNPDV